MNNEHLIKEVKDYWNKASCGTEHTTQEKFTQAYFQEIEEFRYSVEPEIFSFAQFTRYHGKKVLEVGVGAGTDFMQWVRAGAQAHGIDLTQEAIDNVEHRLHLEGLQAVDLKVADAEHLPYEDNSFDLVYSWGVIHHSPDTQRCLQEIIRVAKPGGTIKIMIYHRRSLFAFYRWVLAALFKGKPWRSFADVLFYDQESLGTKAYTFKEVKKMLEKHRVEIQQLKATVTQHDLLYYKSKPVQFLAYILACLRGWNKSGFFMTLELKKIV
jgi:ubiquinone/menaquinone biosynthesis C-methylase UbiE